MTDPLRALYREARVPHPEGFHEILRLKVPAKISLGNVVTIWPQLDGVDIRKSLTSTSEPGSDCLGALRALVGETFVFSSDPRLDPLERMTTPGAGAEFRKELIDRAGVSDPEGRHRSDRLLERLILPAHEGKGHIAFNLDLDKSCYESRAIWGQLIECLTTPTLDAFLDFPDKIHKQFLFQHYIVPVAHELYAILVEDEVWRELDGEKDLSGIVPGLRDAVRGLQDPTVIELLQFLSEKSGNDLTRVRKVIDDQVINADTSLSYFIPHLLRGLHRGIEIDRIPEFNLEQTEKQFAGEYAPEALQRAMAEYRQNIAAMKSSDTAKAVFSTYYSVEYSGPNLEVVFYSQERGELALRFIPTLVSVHLARRILERQNGSYPVSLLPSMQNYNSKWIRDIANKTYRDDPSAGIQFDALKEFGAFYMSWRPALLLAKKRIAELTR